MEENCAGQLVGEISGMVEGYGGGGGTRGIGVAEVLESLVEGG